MDTIVRIPNGNFEDGEAGWNIVKDRGDCGVTTDHAPAGKRVLRIKGDQARNGAKVEGPKVPCRGPGVIELRGQECAVSGRHLGMWIREYDAAGAMLPSSQKNWGELGGTDGQWHEFRKQVVLDEKTVALQLFFLAYPGDNETIEVYLGDLTFIRIPLRIPPWPGQYKLKSEDRNRLTAADKPALDGLVYPNWTQVGVQGGIPDVAVAVRLDEYGAKPGGEISGALDRACREVGARGGGAVLIGEGTFYMDRPVVIRQDGVVIRGSGRDKTRLVFRYAVGQPGTDAGFYWPPEGGVAGPDTQVEVHAYPIKLKTLSLFRNGKQVKPQTMDGGWSYRLTVQGSDLLKAGGPGPAVLKAEAEYIDGRKVIVERSLTVSADSQPEKAGTPTRALLYFKGDGIEGKEYALAEDGKRGDTVLAFKDAGEFKAGGKLFLHAPATDRFRDLIRTRVGGDWIRIGQYEIKAITGNRVTINQPLRIDFPVVDGSYARNLNSIEWCGVEDLSIEHLSRLPITAIEFDWGWNGWVRNVKVVNTGCNGAYAERSKWIEIRNCELDSAWNFDGGQAYAGFTSCHDCLFTDSVVRKYRHGPVVQYGSMGCVFRDSLFEGSDLQWHAGWSTENLFENCVIHSRVGTGSYGSAAYATGSDDDGHGPNGPRNVVYNCDLSGQKNGVVLDGVNENWMILHNRIAVEKGAGFVLRCGSFDHILLDNTLVLGDNESPMLVLKTPDCVGIDLVGNTVYGGSGKLVDGLAPLARDQDNRALPAVKTDEALPDRPKADPPSIYEWQTKKGAL